MDPRGRETGRGMLQAVMRLGHQDQEMQVLGLCLKGMLGPGGVWGVG